MAALKVCLLVTLCVAGSQVTAQCPCRPVTECMHAVYAGRVRSCQLASGSFGVCCSGSKPSSNRPPPPAPPPPAPPPPPTPATPPPPAPTPATTSASVAPVGNRLGPPTSNGFGPPKTAGIRIGAPPVGFAFGGPKPPGIAFGRPGAFGGPGRPPPGFGFRGPKPPSIAFPGPKLPSSRPGVPFTGPKPPNFRGINPYGFRVGQLSQFALARRVPGALRAAPLKPGKTAAEPKLFAGKLEIGNSVTTLGGPKVAPGGSGNQNPVDLSKLPASGRGGPKPLTISFGAQQPTGQNVSSVFKPRPGFPHPKPVGKVSPGARPPGIGYPGPRPPGFPGKPPPGFRFGSSYVPGLGPGFSRFRVGGLKSFALGSSSQFKSIASSSAGQKATASSLGVSPTPGGPPPSGNTPGTPTSGSPAQGSLTQPSPAPSVSTPAAPTPNPTSPKSIGSTPAGLAQGGPTPGSAVPTIPTPGSATMPSSTSGALPSSTRTASATNAPPSSSPATSSTLAIIAATPAAVEPKPSLTSSPATPTAGPVPPELAGTTLHGALGGLSPAGQGSLANIGSSATSLGSPSIPAKASTAVPTSPPTSASTIPSVAPPVAAPAGPSSVTPASPLAMVPAGPSTAASATATAAAPASPSIAVPTPAPITAPAGSPTAAPVILPPAASATILGGVPTVSPAAAASAAAAAGTVAGSAAPAGTANAAISAPAAGIVAAHTPATAAAPVVTKRPVQPNPYAGQCLPLVMCPPLVAKPELLYYNWCRLRDGSPGITCSFAGTQLPGVRVGLSPRSSVGVGVGSPLFTMQPMPPARTGSNNFMRATDGATAFFGDAQQVGEDVVNDLITTTANLISLDQFPNPNSPTALSFLNSRSTLDAQELGLMAIQSLETVSGLQGLAPGTVLAISSQGPGGPAAAAAEAAVAFRAGVQPAPTAAQMPLLVPGCELEPEISCDPETLYRTDDGSCNNLQNPLLGRSLTGFKRLLPSTFDDGLSSIRTRAFRGGVLPSARLVSERVLDTLSSELRDFTLSLMQWSQFIDHDITHALLFRLTETDGIECCLNDGQVFPAPPLHPQCAPIAIPPYDPFYSQFGQRCMSVVRSLPAPEPDCIARARNPLNELSQYLDSSNVYGSHALELEALRQNGYGGLLDISPGNMLPLMGGAVSDMPCRAGICYRSGDTRVNEQSGLTVMHTIFHREHNRIASRLTKRHPDWADEQLFREARRILNAEWQHIIYNEWLPVVVGFDFADSRGLLPLQVGFSNYYDPKVNPAISNAFATAAFRFGHTMVRDLYDLLDANGQVFRVVNVTTTYFEPTIVSEGLVGHARTLVARRSEAFDKNVAPAVHELLFTTNFVFGLDLLAINIQRGRDHGIPTYAQMAQECGVVRVQHWGDLNHIMDPAAIDRLRSVYDDPRDVDLFIGGLSEKLAPGAQVGPTFQCLIAQQFFDLRYGDRFFYDNGGLPHSFTNLQLGEIRKSNWARILCDTLGSEFGNDFTQMQPLGFLTTIGRNQVLNCNTLAIPHVDLSAF